MKKTESSFTPEITIDSPGRINFIGGHTDYNKGFVLPAAIDKKIHFYFRKNDSEDRATIHSKQYDNPLQINLSKIERSSTLWENYILGVIQQIQKLGKTLKGFECIIESNLPIGSGLSSSAALECGMAYGLDRLFDLNLTKQEIISLSMTAEHEFVGTKCGIMDQFASVNGKKDHVMLLDCRTKEYKYIPAVLKPYKVLMLNTNVSHQLSDGQYNSRQDECIEAVAIIQKQFPEVSFLRDVTLPMLEACKPNLSPIHYKRSLFIVEENARVLKAAKAFEENNIEELGKLIYACHDGLKNLYQISCPELDFLVDYAKTKSFIVGARLMGGGFGGCTINLVHEDFVKPYIEEVSKAYNEKFNIDLSAFEVNLSNGTTLRK
ncbi:galactokinase [Flagellimonas iocasae]|uniref:Galactokinase n=1 Tax=Flagellimonas iocasae TaxID=2055905 RepID=A0ABW4Y4E7_9FLAO